MSINKRQLFQTLPTEWPQDVLPEIARRLSGSGQTVVVLDDDPTGTQTVHGIPVLTEWSLKTLQAEIERGSRAFYILTNTRAMSLDKARQINQEIITNLSEAIGHPTPGGNQPGPRAILLSRSDSTLRGHYPGEVEALRTPPTAHAPTLIVPAFFAGGRYTIEDVHYVATGDELVPAGETEFARDASFGYHASNLRDWVEEKTDGHIQRHDVVSISLDDSRLGGPEVVLHKLLALAPNSVCIVNAASERDLEVVALAALECEARGHPLLYRTAASFARAMAGITPRPLLDTNELTTALAAASRSDARHGAQRPSGGLIVVGSYVPKTSGQLEVLLATGINASEVNVEAVLDDAQRQAEIDRVARQADRLIASGRDAVIYTSRARVTGKSAGDSLVIGNRISDALVAIVRGIACQPRFVLAKGGITSSDVATKALDVKRALVLGQLLPGVPVWQLGAESRYPQSMYVVFPGNVGGPDLLIEAWRKLTTGTQ